MVAINQEVWYEWASGLGVAEEEIERVSRESKTSGDNIFQTFMKEGVVGESDVISFLSQNLKVPRFNLKSMSFDQHTLELVPKKIVERHKIVPIGTIGSLMTVATSDPFGWRVFDEIKGITGKDVNIVLAAPKDIGAMIEQYYTAQSQELEEFSELGDEELEYYHDNSDEEDLIDAIGTGEEAPVVRMVNVIVQKAIEQRASDIHFEPYERDFRIRFRVDGVLKQPFSHSIEMYPSLVARMKIISTLDITEKRVPQDGRFGIKLGKRQVDFRVSILPTYFGEKMVLRILDKGGLKGTIEDVGLSEQATQCLVKAIQAPYGMVLITGPTGSGKSTTLYSMLNSLNTPDRNLMTVEDPVEYQVKGITQTQTHAEVGLTFASGLRALLRQSPDVVLVGEIRDFETGDIAIKAALTGHLVFSTLHTNSASGAMTRLIDMDIEPFLIASSVIAVAAQRLIRKICPHCKAPTKIDPDLLRRCHMSKKDLEGIEPMKGKGCENCGHTGYLGRRAVIEVLVVNHEIQNLVIKKRPSDEIEKAALETGMLTLFDDAFRVFKEGETTLEEVLRVASASH